MLRFVALLVALWAWAGDAVNGTNDTASPTPPPTPAPTTPSPTSPAPTAAPTFNLALYEKAEADAKQQASDSLEPVTKLIDPLMASLRSENSSVVNDLVSNIEVTVRQQLDDDRSNNLAELKEKKVELFTDDADGKLDDDDENDDSSKHGKGGKGGKGKANRKQKQLDDIEKLQNELDEVDEKAVEKMWRGELDDQIKDKRSEMKTLVDTVQEKCGAYDIKAEETMHARQGNGLPDAECTTKHDEALADSSQIRYSAEQKSIAYNSLVDSLRDRAEVLLSSGCVQSEILRHAETVASEADAAQKELQTARKNANDARDDANQKMDAFQRASESVRGKCENSTAKDDPVEEVKQDVALRDATESLDAYVKAINDAINNWKEAVINVKALQLGNGMDFDAIKSEWADTDAEVSSLSGSAHQREKEVSDLCRGAITAGLDRIKDAVTPKAMAARSVMSSWIGVCGVALATIVSAFLYQRRAHAGYHVNTAPLLG